MVNPWFTLASRNIQLAFDVQSVIALRLIRLAAGGARAQTEARRMVGEKIGAMAEAQIASITAAMAGRKSKDVLSKAARVYSKRVRANKRRLSRRRV